MVKYEIRSESGAYYQWWIKEVGGMSDLSVYELEDIIWDEFDQTDDHIVPHPSDQHISEHSFQADNCKKPRREVTGVLSNAGNLYTANIVGREKEKRDFTTYNTKRNMMEKDPWSHTPDAVFSASCDGSAVKDMTSLASDDTRMSSSCFKSGNIASIGNEFCANEPNLNDRSTAVNRSSYDYSLGHISQTDDLNFFDNDCEDKESSDLLYYNWPDIGNFEDVDRMFRSCDSSFGLGVTGNEDELGWFSSAGPIDDSVETLNSDFKFPSLQLNTSKSTSEDCEPPKLNNKRAHYISESKDEFKPKEQGVDSKSGVQFRHATNDHAKKDNRMVTLHIKPSKHRNQTEGKRKGQCIDNGGSFYNTCDSRNNDNILSSMDTTHQVFTSMGNRQQRQNLEPGSFQYLQNRVPYLHPDYSHAPDQATVSPTLSGIKVENKGLTSVSSKESSYGSNQLQPVESSADRSFEGSAVKLDDKREKVHQPHGFQPSFTGNPRNVGMVVQPSIHDPLPFQKQVHQSANEIDSPSDVEGVQVGGFQELGVLNGQESTSMNSGLDEISLEATSFRQLQQVMEQLDLRTKLCIRDSLYRLARSAEQRHNYANLGGGCTDYRDADGALIVEGTNKCTGFMDMETDTNPIDRSIAHLLFHRPSETHGMPLQNRLPHKSNSMIHGLITSPPMMAEKLVCQEENAAAESDDKMADN